MPTIRMKWRPWLLGASLAAMGLVGFFLGWWLAGTSDHQQNVATAIVAEASVAETESTQWYTCSMHPQVRSPDPDAPCPICGMALIPVPMDETEEEEGELPRLRLTPRAAALMQVAVWPVESRDVHVPVRLYGRIGVDETRLRTIAAWMPGRLDKLYVDFTGTEVRRGQPMVDIYSPTLITAQEEHLQALQTAGELAQSGMAAVREAASLTVQASHDRLRLLGLDGEQIRRLEQQGRVDERLVISAPADGVVIERLAATGDYVETGQPIYRLVDMSHLWVILAVYESDLHRLQTGQRVVFSTRSYPGEQFIGQVSFIDPVLDEDSRTLGVRVELPNPDGRLKPGMFVRAVIETGMETLTALSRSGEHPGEHGEHDSQTVSTADHDDHRPLVIPATAPLITGTRAVVYVQLPEEVQPTFVPRDIVLGPRAGAWYLVREGLDEGELVVMNGAFKIDAELQIRGRPSMMQPEGGEPPRHDHGTSAAADIVETTALVPPAFQVQLGSLATAGFELVQTLSGDDPQGARQAAMRIDAVLHDMDPSLLTTNAHRRLWNQSSVVLHQALLALAAGSDLGEQRRQFRAFNDALIEMVHAFGVAETGPLHRAMCPMFEGGESFWLQPRKAITNPYFGAMMFTCGEIVETISGDDDPHGGH